MLGTLFINTMIGVAHDSQKDALARAFNDVCDFNQLFVPRNAELAWCSDPGDTGFHTYIRGGRQQLCSKCASFGGNPREMGHDPEFISRMVQGGADVNAPNNSGQTPLFTAIGGCPSVFTALLEAGANVHAVDDNGNTPLHRAMIVFNTVHHLPIRTFRHDWHINALLAAGANPFKLNRAKHSAASLAAAMCNQFRVPLPIVLFMGQDISAMRLLLCWQRLQQDGAQSDCGLGRVPRDVIRIIFGLVKYTRPPLYD